LKKGLYCQDVQFSYPLNGNEHQMVLRHINHCFEMEKCTLITGPTGSGKSTLLYLLAGLTRPIEGQILADGQPISRWLSRHLDLWRRTVGLIFQEPYLLSNLSVLENVAAPLIPFNIRQSEIYKKALPLLGQLDLIALAGKSVKRLSGGERQRVTLARALIGQPTFILADEPTAFQDDDHTTSILTLLKKECRKGCCVVVCSHDQRLLTKAHFHVAMKLIHGHLEPV
jgi:putative ABC transport system ATP-binding protein